MMGGDIGLESRPGEGSRFTVTARFGLAPARHRSLPNTPLDLRGLRVLVVDDNATAREDLMQWRSTAWWPANGSRPPGLGWTTR